MSFNGFQTIKSGIFMENENYQIENIIEGLNTNQAYSLLTHESGHALFGLRDEYYEGDREESIYGYPQCAHNQDEAEEWWGDLVGQIDPFYYEVAEFMDKEINVNEIKIGFINGGCFGTPYGEEGVLRPTEKSMMKYHYDMPVFGSANRRRVEQVLDLFSGN